MTDNLSVRERSAHMRSVSSKDTKPEKIVRFICRKLGHPGYRLNRRDLPGTPDICYMGRKQAIFVHGCFWHGHDCTGRVRKPKSNTEYWLPKLERNIARDSENIEALNLLGWRTLVIWECETKEIELLSDKLQNFLSPQ